LMHSRQYAPDPRLDGMGYGFMIQQVNGREVLFHRGSAFQFNAGLYLLPAENVGLYVAYNGAGGRKRPAAALGTVYGPILPREPAPHSAPAPDAAERLAAYTGEYHLARADFSGPATVFRLLEAAQVSATRDGYLQVMVEGRPERYVEVEPGLVPPRIAQRNIWPFTLTTEGTMACRWTAVPPSSTSRPPRLFRFPGMPPFLSALC
jgi:hypothetical protein